MSRPDVQVLQVCRMEVSVIHEGEPFKVVMTCNKGLWQLDIEGSHSSAAARVVVRGEGLALEPFNISATPPDQERLMQIGATMVQRFIGGTIQRTASGRAN